jgi:subtilisin family serine protease
MPAPAMAKVPPISPEDTLRIAVALGCDAPKLDATAMAKRLPGAVSGEERSFAPNGTPIGWRRSFALESGARIQLDRLAPGGVLRSLVAEYDTPHAGAPRPALAAVTTPACAIEQGRRLVYDAQGEAVGLEFLDGNLTPTGQREPLDAPVPPGRDPGGITVAQIDTGVNYLLHGIARHLARDAAGHALGYDYWAMNDRPFDRHVTGSPFFPAHHGTLTASVLLREAPQVRLIPYRYPRPAMARMGALVDDAAAKGARILTLSLGSNHAEEWRSFADAVRRHPEMLVVVSAGNDGRDLDLKPVYPAALALANKITVTSAEGETGRPAADANWGPKTVDLAVPAEHIPVTGFDGEPSTASGSSFAAPRIAALAARLLLAHPDWHAPELKAAIFARAKPMTVDGKPILAHGFIADPRFP